MEPAVLEEIEHELDFDLKQRACDLLESVGLSHRLDHIPARLSGGEQQRVAIARALINRPTVLLADEPTGNLDPATGLEVLDVLRAQQRTGDQTLVIVTHDLSMAAKADRHIRLRTSTTGLEVEGIEEIQTVAPRRMFIPSSEGDEEGRKAAKRGISRRMVLAGLVGIAGLTAAGAWFASQPKSSSSPFSGLGSTLFIYQGHSSSVNALSWSPDGKYIASASAPLTLRQWRNATIQKRQEVIGSIQSGHVDSTMQVWNPATGHDLLSSRGDNGGVATVAWSPDSKHLASGGLADSTVRVRDAPDRDILAHPGGITSTLFKPMGDPKLRAGPVWTVAWSPDGTRIASGDENHRVQVWDSSTGKMLFVYDKHRGPINALSWSPDGTRIASASDDGTVQVWDAMSGQQKSIYRAHSHNVTAVLWTTDSQSVVSADADNVIRVWDAGSGNVFWLYEGHTDTINTLAWSPGNTTLASASNDKTVRLWGSWDSSTGKLVYTYHGHTDAVLAVTWAADGTRIASGGSDKAVRIWLASNS